MHIRVVKVEADNAVIIGLGTVRDLSGYATYQANRLGSMPPNQFGSDRFYEDGLM